MVDAAPRRHTRGAVLRDGERVMPLELFFDLVFVLALTQCTALMATDPTWEGIGRGLLVLAVLWWPWVGYAWLTSVVDPEEGAVRIVIFAAMAAFLVAALCVPEVFGDLGLTFGIAYGVVRASHIALFLLAARDDAALRRSVVGLGIGTAIGVGLIITASFFDGTAQAGIWVLALVLDYGEPFVFGADGWKLVPGHFAERHGLIVIIALGESIVAIGIGAEHGLTAGVITAAVLGIALVALLWWAYFDVVVYMAARSLAAAPVGRQQNEMARDAYSYLHLPLIAGIVIAAFGLKTALAHVDDPLGTVASFALLGGMALFLVGHVAFKLRTTRTLNSHRVLVAALLLALIPVGREATALVTLGIATVVLAAMIAFEMVRYADHRNEIRHDLAAHHHHDD